jgi:signal peptidase
MNAHNTLTRWLSVALVIVPASLTLRAMLGQPVLLSYVEAGSMAPALKPGDGFVAMPGASS